jgi:hypothetical protein
VSRRPLDEPVFPLWAKIYFAVCAVVGFAMLGVIAWAIIALVSDVTR